MEKAKAAVQNFVSKAGHHDTTVHEQVAPAVQHETVKPHQHEEVSTAVDKEVHQDHFHHTVQPVHDREILPEKHEHKMGEVEHRQFDHRDHDRTKQTLEGEAAKFHDKREVHDTTQSQSQAPVVQGEHVHHHVHETIQPVLHKEVVQPNVVHTTVPIHEVHHDEAKHHGTTSLPPVSMADFQKQGGVLGGRGERTDAFEGCPEGCEKRGQAGHTHHTHDGDTSTGRTTGHGERSAETTKKPSLMDKLNPKKDADGDGKKGFMD